MQRTAQIHVDGPTGTVLVDGQDISHCVRGLTLTADVGGRSVLALDLAVDQADVEGQVLVTIPARTAELLTALGWAPPADYDGSAAVLAPGSSPSVVAIREVLRHPEGRELVVEVLRGEGRRDPGWLSDVVRQALRSTRSEHL